MLYLDGVSLGFLVADAKRLTEFRLRCSYHHFARYLTHRVKRQKRSNTNTCNRSYNYKRGELHDPRNRDKSRTWTNCLARDWLAQC